MAFGIAFIYQDNVTPAVRDLAAALKPEELNPVVGQALAIVFFDHFVAKQQSGGNKLGGPRTNFYARAAQNTSFTVAGDYVVISIASVGIAQRFFGGTIKPVHAKFLTIPARAESYGKRASEFKDLEILWGKNGPYALARRAASLIKPSRRNKDGIRTIYREGEQGGEILFWLVKEVTQQPDPSVLPSQEDVASSVNRTVLDYSHRIWERAAEAPKIVAGGAN